MYLYSCISIYIIDIFSVSSPQHLATLKEYNALRSMQAGRSKAKVLEDVLLKTAGTPSMDYLLWVEPNALVVNPAFVLPYKRYSKSGKDIVMYGDRDEVLAGGTCA